MSRRAYSTPLKVFMADLWTQIPFYDVHLCRALIDQEVDVRLGAITYHLDPQAFKRYGIDNYPGALDFVGRLRLPSYLRRGLKLIESHINLVALYRKVPRNFDLVHIQYLATFEKGVETEWRMWRRMRARFGIPLVYTVHNVLPHNTGASAFERYARLYNSFDALICHSEAVKQELINRFGAEPQRIWVTPHGPLFSDLGETGDANYKAKLKLQPKQTLFLMQGVVSDYKGADILLKAWSIFRAKANGAHLLISGTGDPAVQAQLRNLQTELGLSDSVTLDFRFIPVDELGDMYRAADVAVYPYRQISTSGALLTGIAFAKPIIASDLEPFREALGPTAGRLVKREDPEAFAVALLELHQNQELRHRLSSEVRSVRDESFSWNSIAKKTISCYEAVLNA